MDKTVLAWAAILAYVAFTLRLTFKSRSGAAADVKSFALGTQAIAPGWVGLSLVAQLTSVATFVANPALVYWYGLSGMMGLGAAAGSGIMVGLVAFSGAFRRVGGRIQALSIPQWLGICWNSRGMRLFYAIISLSLASFIVLIAVAVSEIMAELLGLTGTQNVKIILGVLMAFVFAYTLMGGASTSTYTNALQAVVMLIIGLVLIGSGAGQFFENPGLIDKLHAIDANLASTVNPKSLYFRDLFEVFFCNFLVGIAIVCQPHILGKSLLLKEESQLKTYLLVAIIAGTVFLLVMLVGLYARVDISPTELPRFDKVVPLYISRNFSDITQVLIGIGMLCAGLSTLEGILLALSVIFSSDIRSFIHTPVEGKPDTGALNFGRGCLLLMGAASILLAYRQIDSGASLAIFAQYGVYLLFTASFMPLACGMFLPNTPPRAVKAGAAASLVGFFLPMIMLKAKIGEMAQATAQNAEELAKAAAAVTHKIAMGEAGLSAFYTYSNNPAFLATCGILLSWVTVAAITLAFGPERKA